jgi:hypothetical protein
MKESHGKKDFAAKAFEQAYIHDIKDERHLFQKELILIQMEQTLLDQRIQTMKSFVNDLPAYDPQYSMILTTIKMDQIELDELAARKLAILSKMDQI